LRLHLSELGDPEVESLGGARWPRESEGDPLGRRGGSSRQERKRLRTEELASTSKAIGILTSDDTRDLFFIKKSFDPQGYLFLQRDEACSPKHRARKAVAIMKKVGAELKSTKFAALAAKISMSSTGHFDAIAADLEEQAKQLNAEEEVDLEKKEQCEADRQKNTKIANEQSQKIDDQTGYIDRKNESSRT
jgi:hypothetical protein